MSNEPECRDRYSDEEFWNHRWAPYGSGVCERCGIEPSRDDENE